MEEAADECLYRVCRGRCDPALPGNMGKLMRSVVVRNLREGLGAGTGGGEVPHERTAPEINVCCHGQEAGDEVQRMAFSMSKQIPTPCLLMGTTIPCISLLMSRTRPPLCTFV